MFSSKKFKLYLNPVVFSKCNSGCGGCGSRNNNPLFQPLFPNKSGQSCSDESCCDSESCDSEDCDSCDCKECSGESKGKKSKKKKLDGVFCRRCNEFLPMAEPDDKKDGKRLCYKCKGGA